jgi:uncharacterized membrane protein YozB (DUF420 family)
MATSQPLNRRISDRRLYLLAAILTPIIVLIGFGRTYYLKGLFLSPPIPSRLVHFHGLIMTAWVILFVTQVSLVATKRTKTHQKLGILGSILAALVFVVGIITAIYAASRGATPGPPALQFLAIPLGDMVAFAILIGLALYFRKKFDTHKRLMLLAALNLLTPAIARIPLGFIQNGGPLAFFGLTDLCILAAVAFDTIKHRRLHPVFLWGTLFVILWQPLRLLFAATDIWMQFATALVGLVK